MRNQGPQTLPNGDHITAYGNRYTAQEWKDQQAHYANERKAIAAVMPKRDQLKAQLKAKLAEIISTPKGVEAVHSAIVRFALADEIYFGSIQFADAAKQARVEAIDEWYIKAVGELDEQERNLAFELDNREELNYRGH